MRTSAGVGFGLGLRPEHYEEIVAPFTGEEQAPACVAGLLRAMVEGGMLAAFRY
jgi:hypothetical protein